MSNKRGLVVWLRRTCNIWEVEVWNTETLGRFEGGDDFSYFRNSLEEAGWYTNTSTPGTDTAVLQICLYSTDMEGWYRDQLLMFTVVQRISLYNVLLWREIQRVIHICCSAWRVDDIQCTFVQWTVRYRDRLGSSQHLADCACFYSLPIFSQLALIFTHSSARGVLCFL